MKHSKINLSEIKNDIKAGYDYMEYERKYYNGELVIAFDSKLGEIMIEFERDDFTCAFNVGIDEFVVMKYDAFSKLLNEQIYYNSLLRA